MANYFTTTITNAVNGMGDWFASKLANYMQDPLGRRYTILGDYYSGDHRPQLKRAEGKQDDNITINFVGLAIDRSVSRLFKGGVRFQLPEGATKQQEYIDKIWDLNKKEIILYQAGLYGAVHGTAYFKVNPDDVLDPYTGEAYPRLVPLNPRIVRIKTDPQDMNEVEEYKVEYNYVTQMNGRAITVLHREIYHHPETIDLETEAQEKLDTWIVDTYEQVASGQLQLVDSIAWAYEFPPIIHWKNLPSLEGCYGDSEIDDTIVIQDKQNFTASNTGKIIKYHASPNTIMTGVSASEVQPVDNAPNAMYAIPNKDAKVFNLEMQSDLASSVNFTHDLRKSIFDIAREPDISSLEGQLGALTNFGLNVLYTDAIDKNDTKRQLYGDSLLELNRRLLVLAGYEGEASNPGTIGWGNPMPSNLIEDVTIDTFALDNGLADKETIYNARYKARYGVDWETVQAKLVDKNTLPLSGDLALDGIAKPADTAMNGAQVQSLVDIVVQVSAGTLPDTAAEALILSAFPTLDIKTVKAMIASAKGFTPEPMSSSTPIPIPETFTTKGG